MSEEGAVVGPQAAIARPHEANATASADDDLLPCDFLSNDSSTIFINVTPISVAIPNGADVIGSARASEGRIAW
jgi:hypothetical protein